MFDFTDVERPVYHVAVRHATSIDTLPVLVLDHPALVGDSLVLGITFDSTADDYFLFQYSAPSGRLALLQPPANLRLHVSMPAFAPNGRFLAYIAFPGDATGYGVVLQWPSCEPVLRTASDSVPATDVIGGWAQWDDSTHFELYMAISASDSLARFRGTVQPPKVTADRVAPLHRAATF